MNCIVDLLRRSQADNADSSVACKDSPSEIITVLADPLQCTYLTRIKSAAVLVLIDLTVGCHFMRSCFGVIF